MVKLQVWWHMPVISTALVPMTWEAEAAEYEAGSVRQQNMRQPGKHKRACLKTNQTNKKKRKGYVPGAGDVAQW